MQKIVPFLWFEDTAEEAVDFYVSVFKDAKKGNVAKMDDVPGPAGKTTVVSFELFGQQFTALNGGPVEGFKFSPAISFMITCEDQAEVDYYWEKLGDGGKTSQCGWLDDRYGLTWQVIPKQLNELMADPDPVKAARVTQAMLKMTKINIAALQQACDQS